MSRIRQVGRWVVDSQARAVGWGAIRKGWGDATGWWRRISAPPDLPQTGHSPASRFLDLAAWGAERAGTDVETHLVNAGRAWRWQRRGATAMAVLLVAMIVMALIEGAIGWGASALVMLAYAIVMVLRASHVLWQLARREVWPFRIYLQQTWGQFAGGARAGGGK